MYFVNKNNTITVGGIVVDMMKDDWKKQLGKGLMIINQGNLSSVGNALRTWSYQIKNPYFSECTDPPGEALHALKLFNPYAIFARAEAASIYREAKASGVKSECCIGEFVVEYGEDRGYYELDSYEETPYEEYYTSPVIVWRPCRVVRRHITRHFQKRERTMKSFARVILKVLGIVINMPYLVEWEGKRLIELKAEMWAVAIRTLMSGDVELNPGPKIVVCTCGFLNVRGQRFCRRCGMSLEKRTEVGELVLGEVSPDAVNERRISFERCVRELSGMTLVTFLLAYLQEMRLCTRSDIMVELSERDMDYVDDLEEKVESILKNFPTIMNQGEWYEYRKPPRMFRRFLSLPKELKGLIGEYTGEKTLSLTCKEGKEWCDYAAPRVPFNRIRWSHGPEYLILEAVVVAIGPYEHNSIVRLGSRFPNIVGTRIIHPVIFASGDPLSTGEKMAFEDVTRADFPVDREMFLREGQAVLLRLERIERLELFGLGRGHKVFIQDTSGTNVGGEGYRVEYSPQLDFDVQLITRLWRGKMRAKEPNYLNYMINRTVRFPYGGYRVVRLDYGIHRVTKFFSIYGQHSNERRSEEGEYITNEMYRPIMMDYDRGSYKTLSVGYLRTLERQGHKHTVSY